MKLMKSGAVPKADEVDISEIDESMSRPLQVRLLPADRVDHVSSISAKYVDAASAGADATTTNKLGHIKLEWLLADHTSVETFNVNWFSVEESLTQRRSLEATTRSTLIPVTKTK